MPDISELLPSDRDDALAGAAREATPASIFGREAIQPAAGASEAVGKAPGTPVAPTPGTSALDEAAGLTDHEPSAEGVGGNGAPTQVPPRERWASVQLETQETSEVEWHVDEAGDAYLRQHQGIASNPNGGENSLSPWQ